MVHVGDTGAYLLRGGELSRLTQDHTYVQSQVDQGRLTPAEAAAHPQRALLSRALGAGTPVEADLALRTALVGDRYLLCSDGLSAVVGPAALQAALAGADGPETAVGRLVDLAYAEGAPDNIALRGRRRGGRLTERGRAGREGARPSRPGAVWLPPRRWPGAAVPWRSCGLAS